MSPQPERNIILKKRGKQQTTELMPMLKDLNLEYPTWLSLLD